MVDDDLIKVMNTIEDEFNIPISCKICWHCQREDRKCGLEPDSPFLESCGEFKFEPLYLIDYLKEIANHD